MPSSSNQSGKILVIGASGGVGRCLMRQLLDRGYTVLGSAVDDGDLDNMVQDGFGTADIFAADFSSAEIGAQEVRNALERGGEPLTAVISCIGINPCGPVETTPLALFRRTMEINTLSNLAIYQATLPEMRANRGRFIFVSSMAGKLALPLLGYYAASKFALEGLADTMRLEAGQWGIPVSLIEPGAIATGMVHGFASQLESSLAQLDEEGRQNYGDYFAQQRAFSLGSGTGAIPPDDVAKVIVEVLESDAPKARYPVGSAVPLLDLRRSSTDREFDAVLNDMLPGSRAVSAG
ncbi:SDR family NAD(P)-dependent oxidoreductase [Sphingobium tyrosinilyticum]|uniref:SDR family NAD(P)-dependent oxidoreductase n=1 Tax=Sphingobium tyrosinilyticum TaxID=2715436 RepID=A0ABV9F4B2_9SPHN